MKDGMIISARGVVYHEKLLQLNNQEIIDLANLNTLPFYPALAPELERRGLLKEATELVQRSAYVPNH